MCHETCAGQTRQLRHIEANGKAFTNPIKNSEPDGAMLKAFWGGLRPFRNQVIFDQLFMSKPVHLYTVPICEPGVPLLYAAEPEGNPPPLFRYPQGGPGFAKPLS